MIMTQIQYPGFLIEQILWGNLIIRMVKFTYQIYVLLWVAIQRYFNIHCCFNRAYSNFDYYLKFNYSYFYWKFWMIPPRGAFPIYIGHKLIVLVNYKTWNKEKTYYMISWYINFSQLLSNYFYWYPSLRSFLSNLKTPLYFESRVCNAIITIHID